MSWPSALWGKLQSLGFFVFVAIVGCGVVLQKTEIEALKTDSSYIERTARNKLNLARPNEVIFRFETPPPTTAARR